MLALFVHFKNPNFVTKKATMPRYIANKTSSVKKRKQMKTVNAKKLTSKRK